ncbi:MAG: 30S ribosomal protein S4 [Candidatus Beckwithbacteria bacterium GW2011_GWC2_47_9]|uniref:30S ribosomal protein S4 n=1 Tax=Candidatus Beckwithbacteria bacterium GW2011_GWC2_47_9 TaxID=1618373 RepID=A0A0G1WYE3_9BACT|nr:MAG: 30S ribosomal protein S4 [Candidatus Beckwithbacteria bacterium GW2011_GWC2_47_9]
MSRTTRARAKLVRKFKENIFGNPKFDRILAKKPYPPGAHGKKMRRRLSDYGQQLEEKQKLRLMYDLSEKQFHTLYLLARKTQAATGEKLLQLLESRLDTVVYRSGFAPTLAAPSTTRKSTLPLTGLKSARSSACPAKAKKSPK